MKNLAPQWPINGNFLSNDENFIEIGQVFLKHLGDKLTDLKVVNVKV